MNIEQYHWGKSASLAEDYLFRFDRTRSLYEYDPREPASWLEQAQRLDGGSMPQANRSQVAEALLAYNRRVNDCPEATAAIEKLRDPSALVIVGGQQAGLFTGPLLVVYKAITLIQTAREAERSLKRPVVPIFWIAGEDHDFDEVNHMYQLAQDLTLHKIKIEHPTSTRDSISHLGISSETWEEALRQLEGSLMDTEFKPPLMEKLRRIAGQSHTLSECFARIAGWLFGPYGLIVMDSADPLIRKLESPMFEQVLNRQERLSEAFEAGKREVERLGYVAQAEVPKDSVNLFYIRNGERVLLYRNNGGITDRKGEAICTVDQLVEVARSKPESLSNNVLTRPMMQQYLFPVLATVLGPGEISYWGQLREGFRALDMTMPIVVPRLEFTLVEGTIRKQMGKYELTFEEAIHHWEEKKKAWLAAQDTLRLEERFSEARSRIEALYKPLLELIGGINPGLRKLGDTNLDKIVEQVDFLRTKSVDAFQTQFESATRQWERIHISLLPLGKPQERVYNIIAYLNKYGEDWLRQLVETPHEQDGMHRVVYL